jgi:hypothetical protein
MDEGREQEDRFLRTQTTMTIMYEHIAAQCNRCIIIDTASTVCDISHDYSQRISKPTLQTISISTSNLRFEKCFLRTAQLYLR